MRALVRSEDSRARLEVLGYEVVVGDLAHAASVDAAMLGVERVFLLSSPHEDDVTWHQQAIDASKKVGVAQLVRSSILGADAESSSTFHRQHGQSDRYLQDSGVPFTILRPHYFTQNITTSTIPSIDASGNFYGSAGQARLSMLDIRDAAEAAAVVLTIEGHLGCIYDLTGPEALSFDDVAEKVSAALGREVHSVDVPLEVTRQTLAGFGLPVWLVNAIVELYRDYRDAGPDGYAARFLMRSAVDRPGSAHARSALARVSRGADHRSIERFCRIC